MKVTVGKEGLKYSIQGESYPKTIECQKCGKQARIAFVAYEGYETKDNERVCNVQKHTKDKFWFHDIATFAVYFCIDHDCAEGTVLWDQG